MALDNDAFNLLILEDHQNEQKDWVSFSFQQLYRTIPRFPLIQFAVQDQHMCNDAGSTNGMEDKGKVDMVSEVASPHTIMSTPPDAQPRDFDDLDTWPYLLHEITKTCLA